VGCDFTIIYFLIFSRYFLLISFFHLCFASILEKGYHMKIIDVNRRVYLLKGKNFLFF